jgi:ribosomal-protein-alanine N-acetyltransferase
MPRSDSWTIRPADSDDRDLVRGLIEGARWRQQHLDWASALSLLDFQPFLLAEESGLPVGCLACPPDPSDVSWIRVFASASGYNLDEVWVTLWQQAVREAASRGVKRAAALSLHAWIEPLLTNSGFRETNAVLFMEWDGYYPDDPVPHSGLLRDLAPADVDSVVEVDHRAFPPIWRHSADALQMALEQSSYAQVVTVDDEIVGYQISTATAFGAHLARLAVDPAAQHSGLGKAMVADVLRTFSKRGYGRVTVNTQADNLSSQALYKHLGFNETGQVFPVFELEL